MSVSASTTRNGQVTINNLILWIFVLGAIGTAGYALYVALSDSKDKSSDADVQKAIQEALQDYVKTNTLDDTLDDYVQNKTLDDTLDDYVKTTTLGDYVQTKTLDDYVKADDDAYVKLTTLYLS